MIKLERKQHKKGPQKDKGEKEIFQCLNIYIQLQDNTSQILRMRWSYLLGFVQWVIVARHGTHLPVEVLIKILKVVLVLDVFKVLNSIKVAPVHKVQNLFQVFPVFASTS